MTELERRAVLGGLAAAGAGALIGCGGGDDDPDTSGASTSAATEDSDETGESDDNGQTAADDDNEDTAVDPLGPLVVGDRQARLDEIAAADNFLYKPEGKLYLVAYPEEFVDDAKAIYPTELHPALDAGLLAIFQKCTHSGCRVPECVESQQFECPCHGSTYTHYGEKIGGPAPRGLDLFPLAITDTDEIVIDTATIVEGMPSGTDVTGWTPAGQSCLDG